MKINLKYYLGKKRITLGEYCKRNNVKTYEDIKALLFVQKVEAPTEEAFNKAISKLRPARPLPPVKKKIPKQKTQSRSRMKKRTSSHVAKKTLKDEQL